MNTYISSITSQNNTEYWVWYTISLLLLFPIDMLSTFLSIQKYGIENELNPIFKQLLQYNISAFIIFHLAVLVFVVIIFAYILNNIEHTITYLYVEVFLAITVSSAMFVVTNNTLLYLYNITPLQFIVYIL